MFSSLRTLGSDVDHAEALQCLIVAPRLLQNIARAGSPIPRALTQWIRRKALPVLGLDKHPSFWSCLVHGAFEMASSSESPVLLPSEIVPLSDACALFRPSVPSTSKQTERVLSFRRRVRHMLRDSHVRTFVLRRSIGFKSTSFLLPWSVPNGTNQCFQDKILTIFDRIAPLSKHGEPVRALACTYIFGAALVLIGEVNAVAPLLTMCFLVAYTFMNFSCFVLTYVRSPGFRPSGANRTEPAKPPIGSCRTYRRNQGQNMTCEEQFGQDLGIGRYVPKTVAHLVYVHGSSWIIGLFVDHDHREPALGTRGAGHQLLFVSLHQLAP